MYERNAIILERYFDKLFGYDKKENLKTNFKDYCELVDCLERYRDISDEEENIIQEYDLIANKIRDIQVNQEKLNKTFTSIYLIQAVMSIIMIVFYIIYIINKLCNI